MRLVCPQNKTAAPYLVSVNGGEFVGTAQYISPQAVASQEKVGAVEMRWEHTEREGRRDSRVGDGTGHQSWICFRFILFFIPFD